MQHDCTMSAEWHLCAQVTEKTTGRDSWGDRRWLPLIIVVLVLAWGLRLYRLDVQSLWYDEGYEVYLATLPAREALRGSLAEFIPPIHQRLLAGWIVLAGRTEFTVRFPSAWLGTSLVAGLIRMGADLSRWRAGLVAGLLGSLAPFDGPIPVARHVSTSLGGLILEAADVYPAIVLPGDETVVEVLWSVSGAFEEPFLVVEGQPELYPLLPEPGATAEWRLGDRYRTVTRLPVAPHSPGGETAVWAVSSQHGRVRLGSVWVDITRMFALPQGVPALDLRLGERIALRSAEVQTERERGGVDVRVRLYWQALDVITSTYTVFVHVVGPDGRIRAQADTWPQAGRHPTNHWLPGEVVPDEYHLSLPTDVPPGTYRIFAGMYSWETMERLPVRGEDGVRVPEDIIWLGEFSLPW